MLFGNNHYNYIDLTHKLTNTIPAWDLSCGFQCKMTHDYGDDKGATAFRTQYMNTPLGIGTHIDAPAHCFPQGKTIDELELKDLFTDCCVIDLTHQADENFKVSSLHVKNFIQEHGEIKPHSLVIFHTGWGKFWSNPKQYHNKHHFPSVEADAAEMLLEYNIAGIGIDTLSPDSAGSDFPVHRILLGAGKYIIENVANADKMPSIGGYTIGLPISIESGTEAPIRLIGLVK